MKTSPIYTKAAREWAAKPGSTAYISTTDTAKLIRALLKAKFPGTKFSVRSSKYSGGSSIRIKWTDGPTAKLVEAYTSAFAGAGFDGMIDMKYYSSSWLYPDGSASFMETNGTSGSAGVVPSATGEPGKDGAIPVSFSADFVFAERSLSFEAMERACKAYAAKYPGTPMSNAIKAGEVGVERDPDYGWTWKGEPYGYRDEIGEGACYGGDNAIRMMAARRMLPDAMPKTMEAA